VLPSLPVTVTWVAFAAVTVKVDEPPGAIEAGLAAMATVGAEDIPTRLPRTHPVISMGSTRAGIIQKGNLLSDLRMRALVTTISFLIP
jgi:hypothetical protein